MEGRFSTDFGWEAEGKNSRSRDYRLRFCPQRRNRDWAAARLGAAGPRTPEDISVVGYDDMPYAAVFSPGLTTVRPPRRNWDGGNVES